MKKISIGVYVDGELGQLRWTLASLNANAPHDVELLLLLDGVALNENALRTLPAANRLKLSGTSDARGNCSGGPAASSESGRVVRRAANRTESACGSVAPDEDERPVATMPPPGRTGTVSRGEERREYSRSFPVIPLRI